MSTNLGGSYYQDPQTGSSWFVPAGSTPTSSPDNPWNGNTDYGSFLGQEFGVSGDALNQLVNQQLGVMNPNGSVGTIPYTSANLPLPTATPTPTGSIQQRGIPRVVNPTETQPLATNQVPTSTAQTFTRPLPTAGQLAPPTTATLPDATRATTQMNVSPAPMTGPPTPPVKPTGGTPGVSSYAPGNFPTGTPMVPNQFDPQFLANYGAATGGAMNAIGNAWNTAPWGSMNAAQMNPSGVPQVNAQLPQSFEALQFLLSGQGFDPATLARMRAQATDTVSQSAAGTMDAARLAAERAGLLYGGLGIGLQGNVANQAGIQNQQALNNIAIANAQQGIQNLTQGAGMNLNLQENSAQQANQVALQNAANLFSSMTQNLANQQASNAANFAGQQQRALGQAQAQSGYATGAGQNLQNSMTQQYYGANVNNANIANQQWATAGGLLGQMANYGNSSAQMGPNVGAATGTNANTTLGNTLLGYGATNTQKPAGG
jgi:hypothetical protein